MTNESDRKAIVFYFIDDDVMTNGTQKKRKERKICVRRAY